MAIVNLGKYHVRVREMDLMPCRGSVVRVAGLSVESKGPPVGVGQLCEICLRDGRRVPAEVVGFHHAHRILLPLEGIDGIAPNDAVIARANPRYIQLDRSMLGRMVDGLGRPIDGKGPLSGTDSRPLLISARAKGKSRANASVASRKRREAGNFGVMKSVARVEFRMFSSAAASRSTA